MVSSAYQQLKEFQVEHSIYTKGPLSLMIQLTRMVQTKGFPLTPRDFLTGSQGQVAGLGGGSLKKILGEHGITRTLAREGGRTSRGNVGLMIAYIEFLNAWQEKERIDLAEAERYWADQVRAYFLNQPFTLAADPSRTIGASLDDLFEQARKRQSENPGMQYLGTMLQHLVAAKLSIILPPDSFHIHGASVADSLRNAAAISSSAIRSCIVRLRRALRSSINVKRISTPAAYR